MTNHLVQKVLRFLRGEGGLTAVEYALILALIVLVALTGIVALGQSSAGGFEHTGRNMPGQ